MNAPAVGAGADERPGAERLVSHVSQIAMRAANTERAAVKKDDDEDAV